MRWLRFFVVVFRDISLIAENNCCYLSKKYELLINLKFICELVCKLVWNYMKIIYNH